MSEKRLLTSISTTNSFIKVVMGLYDKIKIYIDNYDDNIIVDITANDLCISLVKDGF